MTAQSFFSAKTGEALVAQVTQLSTILRLVEQMAGCDGAEPAISGEQALIHAYERAPGVARRRFELLASRAARFATAGVEALLGRKQVPKVAATQLVRELRLSLAAMGCAVGI